MGKETGSVGKATAIKGGGISAAPRIDIGAPMSTMRSGGTERSTPVLTLSRPAMAARSPAAEIGTQSVHQVRNTFGQRLDSPLHTDISPRINKAELSRSGVQTPQRSASVYAEFGSNPAANRNTTELAVPQQRLTTGGLRTLLEQPNYTGRVESPNALSQQQRTTTPEQITQPTQGLGEIQPFVFDAFTGVDGGINGGAQGIMTPTQVRELLNRPFRVDPEIVNNGLRTEIDRSVRIVEMPRRRPAESRQTLEEPVLDSVRFAPEVQGRVLPVSEFNASIIAPAEAREAVLRRQLLVEDQKATLTGVGENPALEITQMVRQEVDKKTMSQAGELKRRIEERESAKVRQYAVANEVADEITVGDTLSFSDTEQSLAGGYLLKEWFPSVQHNESSSWQRLLIRKGGLALVPDVEQGTQVVTAPIGIDWSALVDWLKKRREKTGFVVAAQRKQAVKMEPVQRVKAETITEPGILVKNELHRAQMTKTNMQEIAQTKAPAKVKENTDTHTRNVTVVPEKATIYTGMQSAYQQGQDGLSVAIFIARPQVEEPLSLDTSAVKEREKQGLKGLYNAVLEEDGEVTGDSVMAATESPNFFTLSGYLKDKVDQPNKNENEDQQTSIDGSDEAWRKFVAQSGKMAKSAMRRIINYAITTFKPVRKGIGNRVSLKDLLLVLKKRNAGLSFSS